jgi:four helix bundle protein
MLVALEVSLQVAEALVPVEAKIRRRSLDLGKQLARASESISLNIAEGSCRKDGDRRRSYDIAYGSAAEVTVALRLAVAKGYIAAADRARVEPTLDRLRGLLYGLTR